MNEILGTTRAFLTDEQKRPYWAIALALALAVIFAFSDGLVNLWDRWGSSQELSHSYFLPVISLWMLWERREAIKGSIGRGDSTGFAIIGAGLFLLTLGQITYIMALVHLGFVAMLLGLPFILSGRSLFLIFAIPIAYLLFMIPPPHWVVFRLSGQFQLMSSSLGVAIIRMFDIPVFLSGNVIELPTIKLQVVEACSGLRYLFPFLSLGALAAYFYRGPLWQRGLIAASTVPITIGMNSFRVAITGVLTEYYGSEHTEGFLHMFEGWVVFVLCITLLALLIWVMTLLRGQKGILHFVGFEPIDAIAPRAPFDKATFVRNGVIATLAVLVVGIFVQTVGTRSLIFPEREEFSSFPSKFPEWQSTLGQLEDDVATTLGADDYIVSDMRGPNDEYVNVYMAYLSAQRDGRSWHSPMQCLPGGGWKIDTHNKVDATKPNGKTFKYNQMIIRQGETRILVNYWYQQRGRRMASEFTVKFSVMWDALVKRRSDGAMIRLMTPLNSNERLGDAQARLDDMRAMIDPVLPEYIPD